MSRQGEAHGAALVAAAAEIQRASRAAAPPLPDTGLGYRTTNDGAYFWADGYGDCPRCTREIVPNDEIEAFASADVGAAWAHAGGCRPPRANITLRAWIGRQRGRSDQVGGLGDVLDRRAVTGEDYAGLLAGLAAAGRALYEEAKRTRSRRRRQEIAREGRELLDARDRLIEAREEYNRR